MKRPLFFAFLALCAGIWLCDAFHIPFLFQPVYPANHIKNFTPLENIFLTGFTLKEPAEAVITAIIVSDPVSRPARYNRTKTTFTARTMNIVGADLCVRPLTRRAGASPAPTDWINACGLVGVVSFDAQGSGLEYGDYILIKGVLSRPYGASNPGCFNRREYLARKAIYSEITVRKGGFIEVLAKDRASRLVKNIFVFKRRLGSMIKKYLPGAEGSVLSGILLGDRSRIKDDLRDRFVKTGTVHVLAISGLHVGLIASVFILALRFLRLPRYIVYLPASVLLAGYAVLTGANTPVIRATIMAVTILIGRAFGKNIDILNCLGLSGIVILLKNPQAAFEAGFQLSFITVASIIILAPKMEGVMASGKPQSGIKAHLKRSIAVSLAAWLGIIPIIAYHFNIISPVCIIANIPVVFLLSFVAAGGVLFLATGLFLPPFAEPFAQAEGFLINALIKTVVLFSKIPLGFFWTHKWNFVEIAGFYIAFGIFVLSLYKKNFLKTYPVMAMLIFLNFFVWQGILRTTRYEIRTTVLDVGHGDAAVVEFSGGKCILIDAGTAGGTTDTGEDIVSCYLRSRSIGALDAVFVTHTDDDHNGGIPAVLRNFKVRRFFDNGFKDSQPGRFLEYMKIIEKSRIPYTSIKRADRLYGFDNANILALNPPMGGLTGLDKNNGSLVLKISSKITGSSFLFCGDIGEEAMKGLLLYKRYLRADFIKIAHHGAGIGPAGEAFLEAVRPKTAFISAEQGDVSASLLKTLAELNCRVYKTYSDGAVVIEQKQEGFLVSTTPH